VSNDWKLRKIRLRNAGDWNGENAMRAYVEGDLDTYARLISQADRLWLASEAIRVKAA